MLKPKLQRIQQGQLSRMTTRTSFGMRSWLTATLIALGLALYGNSSHAEILEELTVKSALIFNLAIFTEWPPATFAEPNGAMQICIVGDSIVQEAFSQLSSKMVGQRRIKIVNISRTKNSQNCHIVFIGNQDRVLLSQILAAAHGKPILTIDDIDGISTYKEIVNLQEVDGKIRLNVNLDLANQAQLKISARLLKLAKIVTSTP